MFRANRLHAVLEAESMTVNGGRNARKKYGGDVNLVIIDGGDTIQPTRIGNSSAEIGDVVEIGTVNRVGKNLLVYNSMGLASGMLTRLFSYNLSSLPAVAHCVLVQADGKQKPFTATLSDLAPTPDDDFRILPSRSEATRAGKPAEIRFYLENANGKPMSRPLIITADSIWREVIRSWPCA